MKILVKCFVVIMFLGVFPARAALDIRITKGIDAARPVAVVPFQWLGSGPVPSNISDVIGSDLLRSGTFKPLDETDLPQTTIENISQFTPADWVDVTADAAVIGSIKPQGDNYLVSFELVDLVKAQLQDNSGPQDKGALVLESRQAVISADQFRQYAHRISNVIYEKLTGTQGAFLTRIAYVIKNNSPETSFQLMIADYDGFNEQMLLRSKEPLMSPSWSPNGRKIAYVSFEGGKAAIYVQDIYDQQRTKVTDYPGINGAPSFSPDGTKLAVTLSKDGQPDIYIFDLKNKNLSRITSHYAIDTEPSWFPDGKSLLMTSERGGRPQIYKIELQAVSGGSTFRPGKITRLTFEGEWNLDGTVTPDGDSVIFVNRTKGKFHIARMNLDTRFMEVLTDTALDESPTVAPNGTMIIYSTTYRNKPELAEVSMDGRFKAMMPLSQGDGEVRSPSWSPFL